MFKQIEKDMLCTCGEETCYAGIEVTVDDRTIWFNQDVSTPGSGFAHFTFPQWLGIFKGEMGDEDKWEKNDSELVVVCQCEEEWCYRTLHIKPEGWLHLDVEGEGYHFKLDERAKVCRRIQG